MNQDIEQLDPFMPLYVQEKLSDPTKRFALRQFKADDVMFVDRLIKIHKDAGNHETVKGDVDWEVLKEAFNYFAKRWPQDFADFKEAQAKIRTSRNPNAYSASRELMYVGSLPLRFERLIKRLYPAQQFDKKFTWTLVKKMPIFKVTGEGN